MLVFKDNGRDHPEMFTFPVRCNKIQDNFSLFYILSLTHYVFHMHVTSVFFK